MGTTKKGDDTVVSYRAGGELLRFIQDRATKYRTTVSIAARQMAADQMRSEGRGADVPGDLGSELVRIGEQLKSLEAAVAEIPEEFGGAMERNTQAVITLSGKVQEMTTKLDAVLSRLRVRTNEDDYE